MKGNSVLRSCFLSTVSLSAILALLCSGAAASDTTILDGPTISRTGQAAVVIGDYIYVIGGRVAHGDFGSSYTRSVERARVQPGGGLGPWQAAPKLNLARGYHSAVVCNGHVFVTGGYNDIGFKGRYAFFEVEQAEIRSDGSIGPWEMSSPLPVTVKNHESVAWNNMLFILGGVTSIREGGSVYTYMAKVGDNGAIRGWSGSKSMGNGHTDFATTVVGDRVFVSGGGGGGKGTRVTGIETASFDKEKGIDKWTTLDEGYKKFGSDEIFSGRVGHEMIVSGGSVYLIGGWDTQHCLDTIIRAPLSADMSLGAWTVAATMSSPRIYHSAVVAKGSVYIIGGSAMAQRQRIILIKEAESSPPR